MKLAKSGPSYIVASCSFLLSAQVSQSEPVAIQAAKGELLSCAYFIALSNIGFLFEPAMVKGLITRVCAGQIETYNGLRNTNTAPIELDPPKGSSTVNYAQFEIDGIMKQYSQAYMQLHRR